MSQVSTCESMINTCSLIIPDKTWDKNTWLIDNQFGSTNVYHPRKIKVYHPSSTSKVTDFKFKFFHGISPSSGWPGQWPTLRQKNISFLEEKQPSAQRGSQLKWARSPDITFFIFCKVSCRNQKSNAEDDFGDNSALEQVNALIPLRPSNQRIYILAPPPKDFINAQSKSWIYSLKKHV